MSEIDPQEGRKAIEAWRTAGSPMPDLQKLIAAHGTYSQIPPEAWVRWDREQALWQAAMRWGANYER
jgi:hypothetical protein